MKTQLAIYLLVLIFIALAYKSCVYRINCEGVENRNLGKIDYSIDLKNSYTERHESKLVFENGDKKLILTGGGFNGKTRQYRAYDICKELDIKPNTKYAYYEYEDWSTKFKALGADLKISPGIRKFENKWVESISISFAFYDLSRIADETQAFEIRMYGVVPFYYVEENMKDDTEEKKMHIQKNKEYINPNPNRLFKYYDHIQLNDEVEFTDIWIFKQQKNGIYYSKKSGIVAFEAFEEIYLRK